jgi:hypothetical protein
MDKTVTPTAVDFFRFRRRNYLLSLLGSYEALRDGPLALDFGELALQLCHLDGFQIVQLRPKNSKDSNTRRKLISLLEKQTFPQQDNIFLGQVM